MGMEIDRSVGGAVCAIWEGLCDQNSPDNGPFSTDFHRTLVGLAELEKNSENG